MNIERINAYYAGMVEGIYRYAWWKDGKQYVGTTGKTFTEAMLEIEREKLKAIEAESQNHR